MHGRTLPQRQLRRQVRRRAEAVDAEPARWRQLAEPQGPVADDPGAQQGRRVHVVVALRQPVGEPFVDEAELGVSTVGVPAGEQRRAAEVLLTVPAEPAAAAGSAEPGHADPVAAREPAGAGP
jgi:hypothetical protein